MRENARTKTPSTFYNVLYDTNFDELKRIYGRDPSHDELMHFTEERFRDGLAQWIDENKAQDSHVSIATKKSEGPKKTQAPVPQRSERPEL